MIRSLFEKNDLFKRKQVKRALEVLGTLLGNGVCSRLASGQAQMPVVVSRFFYSFTKVVSTPCGSYAYQVHALVGAASRRTLARVFSCFFFLAAEQPRKCFAAAPL